jgi:hypothetical protein
MVVQPRNGGTFAWVRDNLCGGAPIGRGTDAAFLGGGNDDYFWGQRLGLLSRLIQIIIYSFDPPTFQQWTATRATAEHASLAAVDEQGRAVREATQCVQQAGGRFFIFHDFLVWDLPSGRSRDREAMIARRRAEAEQAGARFVDLREATHGEASVTWFNDYIHLSQVGHRTVARLMCREISR